MDVPVILIEDGHSYEKQALERWLHNNNTSPMTNNVLKSKDFIVNISLKNAIEEFRERQLKAQNCGSSLIPLSVRTGKLPQSLRHKNLPQLRIKICLLGDPGVGKTTLAHDLQFGNDIPKEIYAPTMGPDLITLHLDRLFEDLYAVIINVFDLPGHHQWKDVWKSHYQCHGAIFVCDVSCSSTMKSIEEGWYPTLEKYGFDEFESVLLCNKIDLAKDSDGKIFRDAEQFSTKNNLSVFHTSGLTGKNVKLMFNQLVLSILHNPALSAKLKERIDGRNDDRSMTQEKSTSLPIELNNKTVEEEKKTENSGCC